MRTSTRQDYERRVLKIQQCIEARLGDKVPPTELAKEAGMSLHHFHRVFRGLTGESVMEFSRRLHLERAARQLAAADRPVLDIALDAGYQSHEAFTRAFVELFNVAPSRYRGEAAQRSTDIACSVPPPKDVEIRTEPTRKVVCMRHVGHYLGVGQTWQALVGWYAQHLATHPGAMPIEQIKMYGLVPDDPHITDVTRLRYDACIEVPNTVQDKLLTQGPVSLRQIPGGTYAVCVHEGPYETLADSYVGLIGAWLPSSGHVLAAEPVVECYLNSPRDAAPTDLRTEIWVRIEERGWML